MDINQKFDNLVKQLEQHKLPTVRIKPSTDKPQHSWSSKFGGDPYWLKDTEYLFNDEGEPLFLLAQLNFAEIPHLEGYPTSGLLQFFIACDDLYGCDYIEADDLESMLKQPNNYRVIYHEQVVENEELLHKDFPQPAEDDDFYLPVDKEYSVNFELTEEIPSAEDYRFCKIIDNLEDDLMDDELEDELMDHVFDNIKNDGSKIGGYAIFTQDDPRGYEQSDNDWLLLFQMDSESGDNGIDIRWGEGIVGNFFIEKDRLEKQDFSRVWYNWDCS